jgi:CBS domain containing-hemolysin-like protein
MATREGFWAAGQAPRYDDAHVSGHGPRPRDARQTGGRIETVTTSSLLLLASTAVAMTALSATGVKSLRSFSRHDLEDICRRRKAEHVLRDVLLSHHEVALAVECLQILSTGVLLSAVAATAWFSLFPSAGPPDFVPFAVSVLGGGLLLAVAASWFPWAIARLWAAPFLFYTWPLWRVASRVLAPLVWGAHLTDALLHRLAGRTPERPTAETIEEEIRTIVSEGHREGLLEEDAREMIEGVMELGDADVAQIMTPRTYMSCMHVGLSVDDAVTFVIASGHSRIPVFDKNRDDIVGILHMKDILPELIKSPRERVRGIADMLRPAQFVPETKPLDALLEEFQRTRNHMAVVLDEYGGVSGLVTIEDVLEEIVGEIDDEHDDDPGEGIKSIDDRTAEARARVRIDEVNEHLGIRLPEDGDFDTIGGFVFSHLGHIPVVGEEITVDDVRITVIDVTRRRIERVRVRCRPGLAKLA